MVPQQGALEVVQGLHSATQPLSGPEGGPGPSVGRALCGGTWGPTSPGRARRDVTVGRDPGEGLGHVGAS